MNNRKIHLPAPNCGASNRLTLGRVFASISSVVTLNSQSRAARMQRSVFQEASQLLTLAVSVLLLLAFAGFAQSETPVAFRLSALGLLIVVNLVTLVWRSPRVTTVLMYFFVVALETAFMDRAIAPPIATPTTSSDDRWMLEIRVTSALLLDDPNGVKRLSFFFAVMHSVACALLPWTVRGCIVVAVPTILLLLLSQTHSLPQQIAGVVLASIPPLTISIVWQRIFVFRAERYEEDLRAERLAEDIEDAAVLHSKLFPSVEMLSEMGIEYDYVPLRKLGGDFIYAKQKQLRSGSDDLKVLDFVVLVDVTGHGTQAALSVHRLNDCLGRIFAAGTTLTPASILIRVNEFVLEHLADPLSQFPTAICACRDHGRNVITWAGAGHPLPLLLQGDGRVTELSKPTGIMLGICRDELPPVDHEVELEPGSSLVFYTDGAADALDSAHSGNGNERLRMLIASYMLDPQREEAIASGIHRRVMADPECNIQDDSMIVAIRYL